MPPPTPKTCPAHSGIDTDIANIKLDVSAQWSAIDKLRNRPPVWATVVISVLMFALGFTLSFARTASRLAVNKPPVVIVAAP